jgi:hypothetical protein
MSHFTTRTGPYGELCNSSVPASFGFSCDWSKLRDFPATAGGLFKLGRWQKVAREIERISDHRWDHGTRYYCGDKR